MKRLSLAAPALLLAAVAFGQLSKYKDWAKSPEADFLTPAEKQDWAKLASDADAEKFIADYWARRGGDAFKQEVSRRIAAADQQFKLRAQKGSESARGRVFITLGTPTRVMESRQPGGADSSSGFDSNPPSTGAGALQQEEGPGAVVQTWIYDKSKFDPSWGIGELRAQISVDPQRGRDELVNANVVNKAIDKVSEMRLAASQAKPAASAAGAAPATTAAPSGPAPTAPAAAPAAPAAAPAPATAALPAAPRGVLDAAAKQASDKPQPGFWGGPFQTVTGDPFYAFQMILPAAKAPAGGSVKIGGLVTKEDGSEATSFWEDDALVDMKSGTQTDKAIDKSVTLPAGSYKGAFGIFSPDGATALATASASFTIPEKSSEFRVSPLVLASTLTPLTKRPNPTDPFVFGMEKPIRVEPKGNHLFSREDGLWYFYTIANPSVPAAPAEAPAAAPTPGASAAPAASGTPAPGATPAAGAAPAPAAAPAAAPKPRIMTRIGVLRDGKPAFQPATLPAELQPLAPGYFASGSEIPLATFEPGYYTFTLQVRDLNAPKDSAAFKGIDRSGDFVVLTPEGGIPPTPAPAAKATPTPKPRKKS